MDTPSLLAPLDLGILVAYLLGLAVFGAVLARRAGSSSEHYFLGGRSLPWWALGASGMSSNLDVAGTMTIVALLHSYGLQGFFMELRGGVVLPLALFLAFMGKWHRRSGVMTTAEWMLLRFGSGWQGRLARATAAFTYLTITVAMVVFFFTAGGRFLAAFLPFSPIQCTLGMAAVALAYTLVGGLYGVVWTDVFQAVIIGAASLYVAWVGMRVLDVELLANWPGSGLSSLLPVLGADARLEPYSPFYAFLLVWCSKGVLEGLGGSPGSAYMAQRFYAASSDRDCRRLTLLWTVLFAFRWPLVLGFTLLSVKLGLDASTPEALESLLPSVLKSDYFPVGARGLMLAAMLAAAMSTFDSTVNAGAAYVVRDLWGLFRSRAGEGELVRVGYASSIVIVGLGLAIALAASSSVLGVWVSIVMLLFPAFLVPFALRWYWPRLNGFGFAMGVGTGFAAAAAFAFLQPDVGNEAQRFGVVLIASLCGVVGGTFIAPATPVATLRAFHDRIRPLGWWPGAWKGADRLEHRRDMRTAMVALLWQVLTFVLPLGAMLGLWMQVLPGVVLWALLTRSLVRSLREESA